MLRVDPQIVAFAPALWIAAGAAALLVLIVFALAFGRSGRGFGANATQVALALVAAACSGSLIWAFFQSAALHNQNAERNALEMRAEQLAAQALAPGSPLACVNEVAGGTVEEACENVIFAGPANVAAAISYVAAQFVLLSDMTDYQRRGGAGIDNALLPLRHALEADPFGLLAQVLVKRDGCTSESCPPLGLLADPSHVRTNIIAQTLPHYLDHYRDLWAKSSGGSIANAGGLDGNSLNETGGMEKRKISADIDFPSAASIPPISIMNPEPTTPVPPEPARKRAETDPIWTPAPAQAQSPR
jgi:hypothetical protein